jgi:RNA polymerase sigma-70 factor (ECF subfamily)
VVILLNDEEIVLSVLNGHTQDYEVLVNRYKDKIYNLAYQFTCNRSDSEDLAQEIFIHVFSKLSSFKHQSSFSTWIHRITINKCNDWYRKNKNRVKQISLEDNPLSPNKHETKDHTYNPEQRLLKMERQRLVSAMVMELPEKYRTAIIMYHYQQLSAKEIAHILNIPKKTVDTRIYRGKKLLKRKLVDNNRQEEGVYAFGKMD